MNKKKITVVLPAYNEEKTILPVVRAVHKIMLKTNLSFEILVVDDGSDDNTVSVLKKEKYIKIIKHLNNRGYGASLKTGAKNANGTFVLYLDADGQHDPSDIPNLLKFINTFDMIVGERKKTTSFIRYPMKKIISILANYLVGTKIPDLNSGFRVINKDIILKSTNLLPDGFSFTTTITLICFESGRSVKYLPIKINKRKKGKSTIHPLKDTIGFVMLILRIITLFNPLKVFLPVSIVFFFIALVLSLYELARYFSIGSVSTLFFITSLLIFCLGLLAEQISAVIKKVYGF